MGGISKIYGLEKSMNKTIYISVPSVQDAEIFNTINSSIELADSPNNIFVGCCHSVPFNNQNIINNIESKLNNKNIKNKFINFYRNMGVGFGRLNSMSMYSGQDYVLQIDGHTFFQKSWDSILIDMYESIPSKNNNILTGYLSKYEIFEKDKRRIVDDLRPIYPMFVSGQEENFLNYTSIERINYWKQNYSPVPIWVTPGDKEYFSFLPEGYINSRKLNANFMFSNKKLAEDYSKLFPWPFLFFEEEFIMSIEAFNLNYSFIFPNLEIPLSHLYSDQFNNFYNESSRTVVTPDGNSLIKSKKRINEYMNNEINIEKIKRYCSYAGLDYPSYDTIDPFYIPLESNVRN